MSNPLRSRLLELSVVALLTGCGGGGQGYGYADLNTHQAMSADTVMQIGSVTKQFTAAAILQLQDAGLLDIDRTVVSYLPTYAFDPRITLRMLLNQTSGLWDYLYMPSLQQYGATGAPESTVLNAVVAAPLLFDPGSAFNYSNSNYYILGSVIEAVSSQTYPDYLAARVFAPDSGDLQCARLLTSC